MGGTFTNAAVPLTNGLFTVSLDFGNQFPGADRWLEIGVRTNGGGGAFTTLSPRQMVTPIPYSITAGNVTGPVAASQVSGTIPLAQLPAAVVTNGAGGLSLSGVFSGNGANLAGVQAVNALQDTAEAIAFANANGISDLATRAALVGMENELKAFNVWSNVTDIFPLYARFHPLSGNTFLGRTFTNRDFTVGSFGVSSWP